MSKLPKKGGVVTLPENESAASAEPLSPEAQQALSLQQAEQLQISKAAEARTLSDDQLSAWMADDEAGRVRFRDGR